MFICIEGSDGSGKTTLIKKIETFFQQKHLNYLLTREPGGTALGEEIRKLLLSTNPQLAPTALTELFLYEAARSQHVSTVIAPALQQKKIVLCDRFTYSSLAYQGVGRGLGSALVQQLNQIATQGLEPQMVIWLKIDPLLAKERRKTRQKDQGENDRIDQEKDSFHKKIALAFEQTARENQNIFLILDASLSADEVFAQLINHPLWQKYFSPT